MPIPKSHRNLNSTDSHSFDLFDETTNCCDKIAAVAQLLASCQAHHLRTETISVAGALIMDEAAQLRQNLKALGRRHHAKKAK